MLPHVGLWAVAGERARAVAGVGLWGAYIALAGPSGQQKVASRLCETHIASVPEEDEASAALQKQCSRLRKRPTCSKSDALVYAKPLFSDTGVHARGPMAMAAIDILLHTIVRLEAMLGAPLRNMASRLHEMHTFRKTRFPSTPKPYFPKGCDQDHY